MRLGYLIVLLTALLTSTVVAQTETDADPTAVVPAAKPGKRAIEARKLFGAKHDAAPLEARAIGFYSRGCLAGAKPLPIDGPTWQAMRLSRNRNWGHPDLVAMIERLAGDATAADGWPGLLPDAAPGSAGRA